MLFPRWLQTILLTVLLLVVISKTLAKGLKMRRSERKDAELKASLAQYQQLPLDHSDSEDEGVLHEEAYHPKPHRLSFVPELQPCKDWEGMKARLTGAGVAESRGR